ncbi:hypothetical protein Tco_0373720 [Tanacetum coccineum]
MRTVASISIGGVSQKSLINHSLNRFWSHVVWVDVVRESLPSVPDAYGQSLEALPSQPAASGTVSDVYGAETRVHVPAHGGYKAHNGQPDSILLHKPKPLRKHRPPPLQSVWSLDELSYPL